MYACNVVQSLRDEFFIGYCIKIMNMYILPNIMLLKGVVQNKKKYNFKQFIASKIHILVFEWTALFKKTHSKDTLHNEIL